MKTITRYSLVAAVGLTAAFCLGASSSNDDLPSKIPADRWIALSANAGLVIISHPSSANPALRGQLWVKYGQHWAIATVEGPISALPLKN